MQKSTSLLLIWISLISSGTTLSILTIENHEFGEHVHDDGWGEWSEWQNCSRTCGGGVTYMQRECLRSRSEGPGCNGSNRMYTSCSIQDCPVDSEDFRAVQCAEHNNITYNDRTYEWIPYIGESAPNPCELYCQPTSGEFSLKLADKVVDGTRCKTGSLNVCVDGTCESVGCDKLLGSDLKLDVCGECNGDGSSCYLVKNAVTAKLPSGYTPLIFIPPGATNIHVYERKGTRNFLAVRNSSKKYILNGHWQVNSSSVIQVAGSTLEYSRKQNKKRAAEHVKIPGPITEMIYIDILVQDRNRGIGYEFYLPSGMPDPNHMEHEWFAEQWNSCSKECGGGLQKRRVFCKNNDDEKTLKHLCNSRERPVQTRKCNIQSCEIRWQEGEWNECTKTCGGGIHTRKVNCIRVPDQIGGSPLLLSDTQCGHLAERPEAHRRCAEVACPEWIAGEWSLCSSSCGAGVQVREVTCPHLNGCNSSFVPLRERSCNPGPCAGNEWVVTEWSECVGTCDEGVQTREVSCLGQDNLVYPNVMCDISERPSLLQDCHSENLCPSRAHWWAEEWSKCSADCGVGIQTRRVVCATFEVGTYRTVSDSECLRDSRSTKPARKQECIIVNCTTSWHSGAWGPCSVTCDGGTRTRVVTCLAANGVVVAGDDCLSHPKPSNEETCNNIHCTAQIDEEPHDEDCRQTTFGCCPDGITAALGPYQESCDIPACENTVYGCCPDRHHHALGVNNQGCPGILQPTPSTRIEHFVPADGSQRQVFEESHQVAGRCRLNADTGTCTHWAVHWFFDERNGRCDRFWYGGCGGNENRFRSRMECIQACRRSEDVQGPHFSSAEASTTTQAPFTSVRIAHTPPRPTPATTTTERASIIYKKENDDTFSPDLDIIPSHGGREGSEEEKTEQRPDDDVISNSKREDRPKPPLCFLRRSSGPCNGRHQRWYFDGTIGTCAAFWYGGCGGNENNFASRKNCVHVCGNKPLPTFDNGLAEENSPPVAVTIKPGRMEVFAQAGKMARLACVAEGFPKPTVTWRRLETQLQRQKERMEILEDYSLIISKIVPEDAGIYECVASNGRGPDKNWQVKLVVKDRVLISETPTDSTIQAGSTAALRCRIQDDVLFVTWYKGHEKVQAGEYYNVQPWGDLHILQAEVDDSGEYTCTAYASDAFQSASAVLTVTEEEQENEVQPPTVHAPVPPSSRTNINTAHTGDRHDSTQECRDYPEYANCNIVVLKQMCHKHDYIRYCCASCGGSAFSSSSTSRRLVKRHKQR